MQLISTTNGEFGFIAIAQEAWGVIAIGQIARGFFVLGQLAVGVVGAGQGAFVVFGVGQVGAGVMGFSGMMGVAGRGFGLVLRLLPGFDLPRIPPKTVPLGEIHAGRQQGAVRLQVLGEGVNVRLGLNGQALPIKLTPKAAGALGVTDRKTVPEIYAVLRREGRVLVCDRLIEVVGARKTFRFDAFFFMRFACLVALALVWWLVMATIVIPDDLSF